MKIITRKEAISQVDRYLFDPRLGAEALLRKRWAWIWMVVTFVGVFFSIIAFLFLGFWQFWWPGPAFIVGYAIAFPLFRRLIRFDLVMNILFSYFIIVIFFALLKVGGIKTSMGFVFIGINCAMGSVLVGKVRWTIGMFILYCTTIVLVGILQPYLETPAFITTRINTIGFVSLTIWINACMLFLVVLFMKDKNRYEKAEADHLKKMDEMKTQLYTNVSHEFRTPLTVISGIADQMDQHHDKWMQKGPEKIKTQSQILLRLVNQMLDISKIEAGGMHLKLIHGDIRKYVQYIASSFHSLAESHNIELQINKSKVPLYIDYDPEKLMHIIYNLISNAIKFTPPGGLISVEVYDETGKNPEIVRIHIRDTGKGIPPEAIEHIFERFYQAPDKDNQTSGTGLGLALTQELVKMMNGRIQVKSKVLTGTEFIVTLPITREAIAEVDHEIPLVKPYAIHPIIPVHDTSKDHEIQPPVSSDKPILLIVEDNKDVIEYLLTILENNFMIEIASNGKHGLEKALKIIPDIILTDVMMPKMDGFELLDQLKNNILTDHIPVVVLTAKGDFQSKLTGLEIGADHYLIKPFNEKELFLKLNNLLEARRKMQQKLGIVSSEPHPSNYHYRQGLLFISKINILLDEKLHIEDFGIEDICLSIGMSRPQLYRKFTALTNKSIGRYIRSYRLYKAKVILETQGKNVTEVALSTGFKNLSHFSAIFREEFGYSPSKLI